MFCLEGNTLPPSSRYKQNENKKDLAEHIAASHIINSRFPIRFCAYCKATMDAVDFPDHIIEKHGIALFGRDKHGQQNGFLDHPHRLHANQELFRNAFLDFLDIFDDVSDFDQAAAAASLETSRIKSANGLALDEHLSLKGLSMGSTPERQEAYVAAILLATAVQSAASSSVPGHQSSSTRGEADAESSRRKKPAYKRTDKQNKRRSALRKEAYARRTPEQIERDACKRRTKPPLKRNKVQAEIANAKRRARRAARTPEQVEQDCWRPLGPRIGSGRKDGTGGARYHRYSTMRGTVPFVLYFAELNSATCSFSHIHHHSLRYILTVFTIVSPVESKPVLSLYHCGLASYPATKQQRLAKGSRPKSTP